MHFLQSGLTAIPQLAIVLGIMVLVHEFGHFAVAKLCGVRVEQFSIGFGRRLFGIVHNGTDYRVNLVPLGGYVKMAGVGDEPISGSEQSARKATNDPGELQNHPRWQRALITLAGPFANFLLAFLLLVPLYMQSHEVLAYYTEPAVADYVSPNSPIAQTGMVAGDRIVHFDKWEDPDWRTIDIRSHLNLNGHPLFSYVHNGHRVDTTLFVRSKGDDADFHVEMLGIIPVEQTGFVTVEAINDVTTPAARAGLQARDQFISIDGMQLHSVDALLAYLQDRGGKPVNLLVQRGSQRFAVTVFPYFTDTRILGNVTKAWILGIRPTQLPYTVEQLSFADAADESFKTNLEGSKLIFEVIQRLFTHQVSVKALQSPIGMGVQIHEAFQADRPGPVLEIMAMISLNLGIFNLLPIPILDGGMMVFLFVESILRRDVNQQLKERIYQVAFVCIVLFAAIVIFNDITRILPHAKT